jgi:hypothetical protein
MCIISFWMYGMSKAATQNHRRAYPDPTPRNLALYALKTYVHVPHTPAAMKPRATIASAAFA